MIRDYNIEWLEKRVWLPWPVWTSMGVRNNLTVNSGATAVTSSAANGAIIGGSGVTSNQVSALAIPTTIASALVGGVALPAQNDGVSTLLMVPFDLDIKKALRFRAFYTQTATSGTVTLKLLYDAFIAAQAGTAGAGVIAAPASVLSTAFPAASGTVVANDVRVTDFGVLNRSTLADTTDMLGFALTTTDASPVAGLKFLGLELRYTPRRTAGPRRNVIGARRMVVTRPLGVQLATSQEGL